MPSLKIGTHQDGPQSEQGGSVPPSQLPRRSAPIGMDTRETVAIVKAELPTVDMVSDVTEKTEPDGFDAKAWDQARADVIQASNARGNLHLDKVPMYVETMRGRDITYVHDPMERGRITTVDNRGRIYVQWEGGPMEDTESCIHDHDRKDYVVGTFIPPVGSPRATDGELGPGQAGLQVTALEIRPSKPGKDAEINQRARRIVTETQWSIRLEGYKRCPAVSVELEAKMARYLHDMDDLASSGEIFTEGELKQLKKRFIAVSPKALTMNEALQEVADRFIKPREGWDPRVGRSIKEAHSVIWNDVADRASLPGAQVLFLAERVSYGPVQVRGYLLEGCYERERVRGHLEEMATHLKRDTLAYEAILLTEKQGAIRGERLFFEDIEPLVAKVEKDLARHPPLRIARAKAIRAQMEALADQDPGLLQHYRSDLRHDQAFLEGVKEGDRILWICREMGTYIALQKHSDTLVGANVEKNVQEQKHFNKVSEYTRYFCIDVTHDNGRIREITLDDAYRLSRSY